MSPIRMLVRGLPWGQVGNPNNEQQKSHVLVEMFPAGEYEGYYLSGRKDGVVLVRDAHGHSVCLLTQDDLRRMLGAIEHCGERS